MMVGVRSSRAGVAGGPGRPRRRRSAARCPLRVLRIGGCAGPGPGPDCCYRGRSGGGPVSIYAGIDGPQGITAGPDGDLWFTNDGGNSIGPISTVTRRSSPPLTSVTGGNPR